MNEKYKSIHINVYNDNFKTIMNRIGHNDPSSFIYECKTTRHGKKWKQLKYVAHGRDGIVFMDERRKKIYKFINNKTDLQSEKLCLTHIKSIDSSLSPIITHIYPYAIEETYIHGIDLGDYIRYMQNQGIYKSQSSRLDTEFIRFIDKTRRIGVHNNDTNWHNIIIDIRKRKFTMIDFSRCRTHVSLNDMNMYWYRFFKHNQELKDYFPKTALYIRSLL